MLSKKDRQVVEEQVNQAYGGAMERYVESYITISDRVVIRNRYLYPALFIKDATLKEDGTFTEVSPLLLSPSQISTAARLAKTMEEEGELDDIAFLCVMNPEEVAAITKEEEEAAVVDLVMNHYSTWQLFKLFLLSLLK